MKKNITILLTILLLLFSFTSCRQDITKVPPTEEVTTYAELFTAWWDKMNKYYVFWDLGERGWRIYIISHIDYQGRDCSSHAAHWLQDNDSSYPYICWNGNIATLEQAKSVASLWAECTTEYIRSYKSFDNIASQLKDQFSWEDDYYYQYTNLRR